ncbi:PAS domain S-box protein [Lacinutrix sp. WUR7]|uniref:sensor histidine kinase n=1 Tax=Lacinutrix sp. WUR7 TaxID=2653681 RepID=UPI00193E1256|nr:ATP-binding protein [Lacinutrix sp. WUR7]QRM88232.1 PAS domain S-box protein [Lacinutrix sp. WUR7]
MNKSNSPLFFKKPLVLGLFVFFILLFTTQYVAYQEYVINNNEQKREINNQASLIKEKLQSLVMYSYSATKLLEYIVERNGIPEDFDNIAAELLGRSKYFDVVELVDGKGFITHVYPLENNEVIGFNILTSPEARSGSVTTIKRRDFFIAGPVNLKQGGVGMVSRQPIFIDDKFVGFSAVVTKISTFFSELVVENSEENRFIYQLSRVNPETGNEDFFLENDISPYKEYAIPVEMSIGEWKLYVVPLEKTFNTAIWSSAGGVVLAFFSGWIVWFFAGRSARLNNLITSKLSEQEKHLKLVYDITSEKVKKSEALFRSLASNAQVAIFSSDNEGMINYVNDEWMKYSGMTFKEAMGSGWINAIHPEDKDRVMHEWQQAVVYGSDFNSELKFLDKKGNTTWLIVKGSKLIDAQNNIYGYIGTASDITERIQNEKELLNYKNNLEKLVGLRTEELNDSKEALLNLLEDINLQSAELEKEKVKAQSADLMKSAFLATMSHELRTPMNSIIGFTGILLKELAGPLNTEQKKQLSMVKDSGSHLLGLINDILDISKIEAGKLRVSFYPFDYLTTLEKTIDFLMPQASKKGIELHTEISNFDITLVSDERRIEQILLNILSNAIKFSEKGGIQIKVNVKDDVLITQIIDQGIGINEKDINKLFMPFIQLEGGLSRKHEGTGLGLAISKNLIEKLGGTIQVESELGKGSNFIIRFPIEYSCNNKFNY